MQFGSFIESLHLGIPVKKKILHKRILVCFFSVGREKALNLADCKLSNGRSRIAGAPYDQQHITGDIIKFIEAAGAVGDAEGCVFPELSQFFYRRKFLITGGNVNLVVLIQDTEIQAADPVPVFQRFLKCLLYFHKIRILSQVKLFSKKETPGNYIPRG